jgi:class 3 adenylate cyclase
MGCGARLEVRCPSCGEAVVDGARFCIACGTPLDGGAPAPASPAPAATEALPEERRWVTVLFADMAGYTAMSERLDPEAVREVVDRCLGRLADEVRGFGGTIDKFIGDNIMALFGAPVSHEDDAERAVRCALAMQAAMAEINAGLTGYGVDLALRVGLNTGEVLAGRVGEAYTVSGDVVNVAARLQSACATGAVTVGERTHRASRHAIAYKEIADLVLKGKATPVAAWEAIGPLAAAPGRRDLRRETPLVGREEELRLLEALYARVEREGSAALATVVGEAGVGKSRLLRELERRLTAGVRPPVVREGRCLPYGAGIVFWALGEIVRAECEISDSDQPEEAQAKLASRLGELLGGDDPKVALVARLLGIGAADADAGDEDGDAAAVRERFFSAVLSTVQAVARERPLVLAFEDIHWADEGMLDLIEYLARWLRAPVLIVCLAREQLLIDRPTWGAGRRGATILPLDPLQTGDAEALVAQLLGDGEAGLAPAVAARSGGNPLFAEELVQRLREEGGGDASELPDTVQALLAARLDALPPDEHRLAQHAAIVGRTFWRADLEGVVDDLEGALSGLEAKDLIVAERAQDELAFKHVLIRDVAYNQLPKAVRARKHFEVGSSIAARAGDRVEEVVALLAEHHGRAAALAAESRLPPADLEPMRAAAERYLEAAGDATAAIYSNAEALGHYCGAAEFADAEADRARLAEKAGDIALRLGRVDAAIGHWQDALRGEQAQETVARLQRKTGGALWHRGDRAGAIERYQAGITLLKDLPSSLELVRLYGDAASLYMQTGDNMLAIYAAEKALRLAEQLGETRAASRAHGIFGRVFGRMGDAEKARAALERSLGLARELDRGETILALSQLAHHLELTEADYARAERVYTEALALAEAMGDVPAQVEIRAWLAQLALHAADWERVRALSDESAALSEREGLAGKLCLPGVLRGVLRWRDGEFDAAATMLRDAYEGAHRVGWTEVACAALLALATVERDAGRPDVAAATADRAAELCERAGLTAQGVQAAATSAVALALEGQPERAAAAAERAAAGAKRVPSPACRASAREAAGAAEGAAGVRALDEARSMWEELGRPLDAARCALLAGRAAGDGARLEDARALYERLGVPHLAEVAVRR